MIINTDKDFSPHTSDYLLPKKSRSPKNRYLLRNLNPSERRIDMLSGLASPKFHHRLTPYVRQLKLVRIIVCMKFATRPMRARVGVGVVVAVRIFGVVLFGGAGAVGCCFGEAEFVQGCAEEGGVGWETAAYEADDGFGAGPETEIYVAP